MKGSEARGLSCSGVWEKILSYYHHHHQQRHIRERLRQNTRSNIFVSQGEKIKDLFQLGFSRDIQPTGKIYKQNRSTKHTHTHIYIRSVVLGSTFVKDDRRKGSIWGLINPSFGCYFSTNAKKKNVVFVYQFCVL